MSTRRKPSGFAWAPTIPDRWDSAKVCLVARLESGHTPSRQHPEYWVPEECTIPWFSLADVWQLREANQMYLADTSEKISPRGVANSAARVLPAGTVVLSRTASVGFAGIMPRPMATTQDFANWVCGPRVIPEYLLWAFRAMKPEFARLMMGSTHQTIYMPDIRRLAIPVPSLSEQRGIADFLDRKTAAVDTLTEKKKQLLSLLTVQRQVLIDNAAMGGETTHAGSEWFPRTPDGWSVKRLKHIAVIHSGIAKGRESNGKPTSALPYLRVANVQNGYLDLTELSELEVTAEEAVRFALRAGDVLMNEGGDFDKLGRGFVWEGQVSPCLHQNHVFAVRPHPGVNPYWINLATQASYLRHFFTLRSKQSTNLASISSTNLGEAPILMPPAHEVEPILSRLEANLRRLDALRATTVKQLEHLSEYRQALITAAVTGQLDVAAQEAA